MKKSNNALIMAKNIDKILKAVPPVKEESPATSIGNSSVALPPLVKQTVMTDRRYRKDKQPVMKKFKAHMKEAVDHEKKIRAHHDKLDNLESDAHDAQYGRARSNKAATTKVRKTLGKHISAHYARELDPQEKVKVYTALQNKKALPKL